MKILLALTPTLILTATCAGAQSPRQLGSVASADATVSGSSSEIVAIASGSLKVGGGSTVAAKAGHNALLSLARGGSALVCQTTALRLNLGVDDALSLALDRGAMELRTRAVRGDTILTPDLRLDLAPTGQENRVLDLRLRVTPNGDTCVENRGHKAPQLMVSDSFGETHYLLQPGQHVLFEQGSLRAVMDRETTPCGCPPPTPEPRGVSLADAVLGKPPTTPKQAAAANPFPEAVSDGLAAPDAGAAEAGAAEAPGVRHVQVSSTLRYDPGGALPPAAIPQSTATETPQTGERHSPLTAIGRFFKRVFVR